MLRQPPGRGALPVLCALSEHPGFNSRLPKIYTTESKYLFKCCCIVRGGPDHKLERGESLR